MSHDSTRNIPQHIKDQVMRECYFGCVMCGIPFFEFDHIDQYAGIREHTVANIALLCPNHHRDKTSGRLSPDFVRRKRLNPFNKNKPFTSPALINPQESAKVNIGGAIIKNNGVRNRSIPIINADGFNILSLKLVDDNILLSLQVYDTTGVPILLICDGEMIISTGIWKFHRIGRVVKVKSDINKLELDMKLSSNEITINKMQISSPFGGNARLEGGYIKHTTKPNVEIHLNNVRDNYKAICIFSDNIFLGDVNCFGYIVSDYYLDGLINILKYFDPYRYSNSLEVISDVFKMNINSIRHCNKKYRIEMMNFYNRMLAYHLDKNTIEIPYAYYNLALSTMAVALDSSDVNLAYCSYHLLFKAIELYPNQVSDLNLAQALGNAPRIACFLLKLGQKMEDNDIDRCIEYGEKSLVIYARQDNVFHESYCGTELFIRHWIDILIEWKRTGILSSNIMF